MDATTTIERIVTEAHAADAGRGIARLDPADLAAMGVAIGNVIELRGRRSTYARALPTHVEHRGLGRILVDGNTRANAGVALGDRITLVPARARRAEEVTFTFDAFRPTRPTIFARRVSEAFRDMAFGVGDQARLRLIGGRDLTARVTATRPDGAVVVGRETRIVVAAAAHDRPARMISYEDLGGLSREVARVREMIELPIRRPELFARLGIEAPKGVLLSGPPGTGKTLLARAVAEECEAAFFRIDGPEIVSKHYGESEAHLRAIFEKAEARAPAIVFIDEIDAIAPKRDRMSGDRQLERRVVAQLLTLLDGLSARGSVVVMAATNLPDSLDPALRRPGRFDREITIGVPDRNGRREILAIHTRGVPLAPDVEIEQIAAATHGFVGADLAALVREAGMAALRRAAALDPEGPAFLSLDELSIAAADFADALAEVRPSAIREVFTEVPEVRWSDIGGMEAMKDALVEAVVWPMANPGLFAELGVRPAKGVMLVGPPGTGKTLLARALASEAKVNFIAVRGPELLDRFVGESERAVRDIFSKARSTAPTIVFFDEIDALAPPRGGGDGPVTDRVVSQLLTEIDGIEELKDVFLLAATNRIDCVDGALLRPGRFDRIFEVPVPDIATRVSILRLHSARLPLDPEVDLEAIAAATDGLVGAELAAICQQAGRAALHRFMQGESRPVAIVQNDLLRAVDEVRGDRRFRGDRRKRVSRGRSWWW
jgi:transitional endoplasmic reticulum ATPase